MTTKQRFIERARQVHGAKYDYTNVVDANCKTKVEIICPIHGPFFQCANKHISSGTGCPACGGRPIINTEVFISRAKAVHGNKYDYSLCEYKNDSTKMEIICPSHGPFLQDHGHHVGKKQGCPECKREAAVLRGIGGYNEHTIPENAIGILYCVEMVNDTEHYCKVGITKNSISRRLYNHGCKITHLCEVTGDLKRMYLLEQEILTAMLEYRYKYKPLASNARLSGWTECFRICDKDILLHVFDQAVQSSPK